MAGGQNGSRYSICFLFIGQNLCERYTIVTRSGEWEGGGEGTSLSVMLVNAISQFGARRALAFQIFVRNPCLINNMESDVANRSLGLSYQ